MTQLLWTPKHSNNTSMVKFIEYVQTNADDTITDYSKLYYWSVKNPAKFWEAIWHFCEVIATDNYTTILQDGSKMPGAKWFGGAKLNFAENLLRRRDSKTALTFCREDGLRESISYAELYKLVAQLTDCLQKEGIKKGDRIAGYLPNCIETVAAMLATTSLGAIWSSCSPDFGIHGVVDRFSQIEPKIIFAADGHCYNGKRLDVLAKVKEISEQIPSLNKIIIVPHLSSTPKIPSIKNSVLLPDFISQSQANEINFVAVPFNHPLYIMFSSGTTGVPKCIVHGAGGTLLQHLKELILHTDLNQNDVFCYFTTCGWMMWNWMVSGLVTGATVLLYDGSPFFPHKKSMFQLIADEKITIFGTSAKYIAAVEKAHIRPKQLFDLKHLRCILATGSPLPAESFDYVYQDISSNLRLSSISGGTDIISCFCLGNPLLPVYRGELQCRGLGMNVEIFNDQGQSVLQEKGELVCTAPFPSMPIYFWNDPDGSKFHKAYFEKYPNVWAHGDYAEITEHNGIIIYGRSDAILNPGGVRIGTAEIYRQVEKIDDILESIAIGQTWQNDERIILFVVLRNNISLNTELIDKIKKTIRENTSPRHVPAKVIQIKDIPRTISGKIVELAVRNVVHGESVKNKDALANPEALKQFENIAELQV